MNKKHLILILCLFMSCLAGTAQALKTRSQTGQQPTKAQPNTSKEKTASNTPMAKQIPLEDFFRNPVKSQYQISPKGNYYSYLAPFENRMNLFISSTADKEQRQLTKVTDRDIAGYTWANEGMLIYMKDNGGDENYVLYSIDLKGVVRPLTPENGVRAQFIDDLEDDEAHILIETNERDATVFDPYLLNVNTGERTMLEKNPGNISGWVADHKGTIRVATTTDGISTSLLYKDHPEAEWETLLTTDFTETLAPLFFTFDNMNLYCLSNIGRDKTAVVMYNLASKTETEVLFQHPMVDVDGLNYSNKRKVLTSITYTVDKTERHFLDEVTQKRYENVKKQLPDHEIAFTGMTKEEDKFIVRTYSDRSLGAFYLYDDKTGKVSLIEQVSPWLEESELCEMKPVQYKSRDGLVIHGYLTLPKGVDAKNLPVVINPHGGPWARDDWGYNPEVQFLANRGYAVLQMNFRGSTGYGKSFWQASFKQWGKKMQDDISDGVEYLIREGIADPKRVAIYGGSYGGYATLAGLTFTPQLYACGIDYVGVSNLFTFMGTIPPYWQPYLEMMYAMVGNPESDKALLESSSPVMHADRISAPLLIAQGAKDPRVNIDESDQMVKALQARGIEVEYLVEPEEGHGFRNEENRFKFYRAMEKFLAQHLATPVKKG